MYPHMIYIGLKLLWIWVPWGLSPKYVVQGYLDPVGFALTLQASRGFGRDPKARLSGLGILFKAML